MKKAYKTIFPAVLFFCLTMLLLLTAQKIYSNSIDPQILKGRIIDPELNAPLPYSTVVLFDTDSAFIAGTISGEDGTFEFGKLKSGTYRVVVKFVGYDTKNIDQIELSGGISVKDLGDIRLSPAASEIGEVTITQNKARVENHPDKKIINVPSGGITDGGVVADALVQVPSITLDANRNVLLRGSTQYKVLIDGVPSPLDGNEALKGLAVSNIEKIEVITNPSSAYDSEGTAGIINVIMKKEKTAALAAQIGASASSNGSRNENFSLMGQGKKLNYNLSFDDRLQKENSTSDIRNYHFGQGNTDRLQSKYDYQLSMQTFKSDATYQINESNSLQALLWVIGAESDQLTTDKNQWQTTINSNRKSKGIMPQLRFNHKFNTEGSLITFFAQYNNGSEVSEQQVSQTGSNLFRVKMDIPFEFVMLREDLTLTFGDQLTFLSGLDYKYSGFDYLYDYYRANSSSWTKDEGKSNQSSFRSDIFAAYLQLKGTVSGFGFQAGVRAENTDRVLSDESGKQIFNYNKLSLFPSLTVTRSFGENSSLMASYSRRLNRPRLFQLNPFRNYSNPGYVSYGNYELAPEFQNTIELAYSQRIGQFNLNSTLYGKFTDNSIIQTSSIQNDTVFFSYRNAKSDKRLGAELSLTWNPAKWFSGTLNGNFYNFRLEATDTSKKQTNNQGESSLNLMFNPLKDLSIQSFSTLKSKSITAQGYIKGYFTNDLAVSKQFFEKRLRASLKVTDLFDGVKEVEVIETSETQWQRTYKPDSRQVILSLTLNINKFARKTMAAPEATPY